MTPPSKIIRQLLIDLDLAAEGTSLDWSCFYSLFPDTPDSAICVFDTAALPDGRLMKTGERIEHPGIMVEVRAIVYEDAYTKAQAVAAALDSQIRSSVVLEGEGTYLLHNVSRSGSIIHLGIEEEGERRRHSFTINATITIETKS